MNPVNRLDTIAPIVHAMGCDMKYNLGPSTANNIIVEGITDKMYIDAMFDYCKIQGTLRPNVIPSTGAENVHLLVSILIGWNCSYHAILDYDREGFTAAHRIIKNFSENVRNTIAFISGGTLPDDPNDKTVAPMTIESLIDDADKASFETPYNPSDPDTKKPAALEFLHKVSTGKVELSEITVSNFRALFISIGIENV